MFTYPTDYLDSVSRLAFFIAKQDITHRVLALRMFCCLYCSVTRKLALWE